MFPQMSNFCFKSNSHCYKTEVIYIKKNNLKTTFPISKAFSTTVNNRKHKANKQTGHRSGFGGMQSQHVSLKVETQT